MEVTEKIMKEVQRKFPVMNIINSVGQSGKSSTRMTKELKECRVALEIGLSNVYIVGIEPL